MTDEYGGRITLQAAAEEGHLETVEKLLAAGADVNAYAEHGQTALQAAAERGHLQIVEILLTSGADVNAAEHGQTALQVAAEGGYLEIVEKLLVAGADVNADAAEHGQTALQAASEGGYPEIVEKLLAAGADINAAAAVSFRGQTALQAAAEDGHLETVEKLLAAGADVNATATEHGQTALQAAAERGHLQIVEKLLVAGANFNAARYTGWATLQAAAGNFTNSEEVMELLLNRQGEDVKITKEVVKAAAGNSRSGKEVMELLLNRRGEDVKITEEVMKAAAGNSRSGKEVVELLLDRCKEDATIQHALTLTDTSLLLVLLEERFEDVTKEEYAWIIDLEEISYTRKEIAEILFERLVRLDFASAVQVLESLRTLGKLHKDRVDLQLGLAELQDASQKVLSSIIPGIQHIPEPRTDLLQHSLHISSLVIQFLCVSFLSYSQAHIGNIQPFFLDTPLQRIVLLGTDTSADVNLHLTASLIELTCLAGMTKGPVLVFDVVAPFVQRTEHFDVRAFPEDVLDTWGPGQLVCRAGYVESPLAIKIGGGYICPSHESNEKYHWDRILPPTASSSLDLRSEIVIGSLVTVNASCNNDVEQCWNASMRQFHDVGAHRSFYEATETQIGLQGGPDYLAMTANRVWQKRRGKTIKAWNLERGDNMLIPFLNFYWGVRVSFCTGVAQRVPLTELVADVLPAFAKTFTSEKMKKWWDDLVTNHSVIERFRGAHPSLQPLQDWLGSLSEELHSFIHKLIRQVLETLEDTGLSPDGTYFSVAWPWDDSVTQGFRIHIDDCMSQPESDLAKQDLLARNGGELPGKYGPVDSVPRRNLFLSQIG
ncbi:hypothetical protein G7Z17_g8730 [Cylindrodendrum hubeiense]|uniref:Uncharacterized protein n=1 Tax=Cylindrodendrum hubeiense TaxID=595255 RepID=A0A9P5H0Q1_9HYPO|nr:hypothetical protein G7Z17_g8730 [Cylindrodendrum hubeiense]